MTAHQFCHILLFKRESSRSAYTPGEGPSHRRECQEAGTTGDHVRGCLPKAPLPLIVSDLVFIFAATPHAPPPTEVLYELHIVAAQQVWGDLYFL